VAHRSPLFKLLIGQELPRAFCTALCYQSPPTTADILPLYICQYHIYVQVNTEEAGDNNIDPSLNSITNKFTI